MLGASSSEEEEDFGRGPKSDRDDVSVIYSVPDRAIDRDRKLSGRSASPSDSYDVERLSYSGSIKTPSVAGTYGSFSGGSTQGGTPQPQHQPIQPSHSTSTARAPSPSPSVTSSLTSERVIVVVSSEPKMSKDELERVAVEAEEEERKIRMQLYVFVAK